MKKSRLMIVLLMASIHLQSRACTVIACAKHGEVFAAANEDDYTPFIRMWFNPATKDRYGSVCFGASDLQIAAAMNEYGLFYDYTAQYSIDPSTYKQAHPYYGDLMFELLGKCKTVKEAMVYLKQYDYAFPSQVLLADASGNSVIVNPSTKVMRNGDYQVSTNFNILDAPGRTYKCMRFDLATQMLENTKKIDEKLMRNILAGTHQEGNLATQYSAIYDLKRGNISLYLYHDFNTPYQFNLKEELKKGYRMQKIDQLFLPSFAYSEYVQSHQLYQKEKILDEMNEKGIELTAMKYINLLNKAAEPDSTFKFAMLEVALQLVKDAYNKNFNGASWPYWFAFESGYKIIPFRDTRLNIAEMIFTALALHNEFGAKYINFIKEMRAYVLVTLDDRQKAKFLYAEILAAPQDVYPITLERSRTMIKAFDDVNH